MSNNIRSIAKNSIWLAVSEAVNGILMFLITIFLARYLGVDGYGKLMFALSFVTLFIIPVDLGLSPLTTKELAGEKKKTKSYLDNLILIRIVLGLVAFLLILITVQFLGKNDEVKYLIYLLGIWTVFQTSTQFFQAIFRAHEKMFFEAITRISHAVVLTIATFYFILSGYEIVYFGWAYCFASFFTLIIATIFIWTKFSHFRLGVDVKFIVNILKKSWPFALSLLFVSLNYYIDSVMLGIIRSDIEVGLYNAAYKLIVFILIIGSVISRSTYPIISKLFKTSIRELQLFLERYSQYMFIVSFPIAIGGIILSSKIINFIYGENFSDSALAFQILIISAAIIYISTIYAHSLQICNKQKTHLLGMGIGTAINVTLNLILIPYFGLMAAAITTLTTELYILLFMYFNFYKIIKLHFLKYILKPIIASIFMLVLLFLLWDLNLFILLVLGIISYAIIIVIIGGFPKNTYKDLKKLITGRKAI